MGRKSNRGFFHIQGSGRLRFPGGEVKRIRFLGSNDKQYTSIGKVLIERKEIKRKYVNVLFKRVVVSNKEKQKNLWKKMKDIYFLKNM